MADTPLALVYYFDAFALDLSRGALLSVNGQEIPLRPKSFALLQLLVQNAGRLLARTSIMETLWPNVFIGDDGIGQCIHDIRGAFGNKAQHLLRTVPRRGYIFEAIVTQQGNGNAPSALNGKPISGKLPSAATLIDATPIKADYAPQSHGQQVTVIREPLEPSLLVLSLRPLDDSSEQRRLAEQITDNIITDLTHHLSNATPGAVRVMFHDDRLAHWRPVTRDCQPDYVLRGSLQGNQHIQISLQLLDAQSGTCIWAERCALVDPHDLVARLAHGITVAVVRDIGDRFARLSASDVTPLRMLLQGRSWLTKPASRGNRRQARWYYDQALIGDPESIAAKLGIATVLTGDLADGWSQDPLQDETHAEALLQEVLQAGTHAAFAHGISGTLRRLQGRLDDSRRELELAVDLAPHYTLAASQLGITLAFLGKPDAALPHLEKIIQQAPEDPQRPLFLSNLGLCRLLIGDIDAATETLRTSAAENPHHFSAPLLLAAALGLNCAYSEARLSLQRAIGLSPQLRDLSKFGVWVRRQASPDFVPIYEHMIERGLQCAADLECE